LSIANAVLHDPEAVFAGAGRADEEASSQSHDQRFFSRS
jgi:hypothetical protein